MTKGSSTVVTSEKSLVIEIDGRFFTVHALARELNQLESLRRERDQYKQSLDALRRQP